MAVPLFICVHLPDFCAQTFVRLHPGLRGRPIAVLQGDPPLETVFAVNPPARAAGVQPGMGRPQAESFDALHIAKREMEKEKAAFSILVKCAENFSPRIEPLAAPQPDRSRATLLLDVSASERLFGSVRRIVNGLHHNLTVEGFEANLAASSNAPAALLAARGMAGITVIAQDEESQVLAPLPLSVLDLEPELAQTFAAWGIGNLGELAALPERALHARLGSAGTRLQSMARGEHDHLLAPAEPAPDAAIVESVELDHPVDLLEPLLFLLGDMLQRIIARAAERSLSLASLELELGPEDKSLLPHRRTIRPALPERNHTILLKLIRLDLETVPPAHSIIALHLRAQPARPQVAQHGLFLPQTPEAGKLDVLLARLRKLIGPGRVGSPQMRDSFEPENFHVVPFIPHNSPASQVARRSSPVLRVLRPPRSIRVRTDRSTISALMLNGKFVPVAKASGPWKTSGAWWTNTEWCREEWEVILSAQQPLCCRIAHDPNAGSWYLTGFYD